VADSADPLARVAPASGYSWRYRDRGHYFINSAIGAVAFLATCFGLHALLPFPEVPEVTPKLRYFVEHKDEFDTLFVGSSRIYRHVAPATFDRVAAGHGVPTHSFNLAFGGMHPPESFYLLDQALRAKPAKLKWVFVELEELYPTWPKEKRDTQRFRYWHNWPLTWLAVAKTINSDGRRSWWKMLWQSVRSDAVPVHIGMLMKNFANVAAAKDLEDRISVPADGSGNDEPFAQKRGYEPHLNTMPADQVAPYLEQLQRSIAGAGDRLIDPITDRGYRDCARIIRDAGAAPIFIVPPDPSQKELRFRDVAAPPGPVFAFNKATKYSVLYDPSLRVDVQHLTPEGAEIFTRLLAERFAAEVASPK
jgi:hypothetical protein